MSQQSPRQAFPQAAWGQVPHGTALGSEPKELPWSSSSGRPAPVITTLKTGEPGPGHQTG